jgi:cobalt-zinc-cadmium efflux system outer membrane protein
MNHPLRNARARVFLLRCLCASVGLWLASSYAAEPKGKELSLRDAITATLAANPQLNVYPFREAALAGERATASLAPPLQLNGNLEDAFGSGTLQAADRAEFTLSFSQVVEIGGQRTARVGVVEQKSRMVQAQQRVTELDLLAETTRRFIALASAQEMQALAQRAAALAQQTLDALTPLVKAGQSPASEQARATAALKRAELTEARARTELEAARFTLAAMWNSSSPAFEQVYADLRDPGTAGDLNTLLIGLDSNPDIAQFAAQTRLHEAELTEARSQQRGTVQWSAGIRHLRETGDTGFVLSASLPLGARARAGGAITSAEAQLGVVQAERDVVLNRMRTQLQTLYLHLQQAIVDVNTLRDAVLPQLETAQEQTRVAYLNGRYSYLELISAQSEYLDAERALIDAATDAHLLRAEIERLTGEPLRSAAPETTP